MSTDIVRPQTPDWVKAQLSAIYQSATAEDFNQAFDNFIAHRIHSITFNGQVISCEEYKRIVFGEPLGQGFKGLDTLDFQSVVEAPSSGSSAEKDFVGVSFTAEDLSKFVIHDSKEILRKVQSTIIVEVENDQSIHVPPPTGIHRPVPDTRRVFKLTQVLSLTGLNGAPVDSTKAK